jgi:hypothetical protein
MKKVVLLIVIFLSINQTVFSQAARQTPPAKPVVTNEKGASESAKPDLALDIRLAGGLGVPLGVLSDMNSDVGGGGHFDAELRLPFALGPLEVKVGLSAGFFGFGLTSADASISMVPILGFGIVAYPIKKIGLTPYLAIGGGGNATSWSAGSGSGESFDGTLAFRLGAGYAIPSLPKLSIILDVSYLIVFEEDSAGQPYNGEMLNIELGVSYRLLGK